MYLLSISFKTSHLALKQHIYMYGCATWSVQRISVAQGVSWLYIWTKRISFVFVLFDLYYGRGLLYCHGKQYILWVLKNSSTCLETTHNMGNSALNTAGSEQVKQMANGWSLFYTNYLFPSRLVASLNVGKQTSYANVVFKGLNTLFTPKPNHFLLSTERRLFAIPGS